MGTEKKSNEQRLEKEVIELETIFNAAHDAMFLVEVDKDEFRYIRNNTAYQKLTGFSLEEIKNKTADAYDAMTSDRPYRKGLSQREAVEEIVKNAGTQFDPEVVKAFMKSLFSNKKDAS